MLESMSELHSQKGDCCGDDDYNFINIETEDGGGGKYIVIKTDRWAIDMDDIQEFIRLLDGFAERSRSQDEDDVEVAEVAEVVEAQDQVEDCEKDASLLAELHPY